MRPIKKTPRRKIVFSREQSLASKPLRNRVVAWEHTDKGEIRIWMPRKKSWAAKTIERIFPLPENKEMVLDEIGSFVWELCDGKTTVEGIVVALEKKYKLNRKEVEVSVTQYLRTLAQRGLIGFQIEGGQP